MDYLSSPILNHWYSQNNDDNGMLQNPTHQVETEEGDQITPSLLEQQDNNNLLPQIPTFLQETTHIIARPSNKRSLSSTFTAAIDNHEENVNDRKKKQKILHREVERQRRHEMSSLHTSLKSLLPLQYIKGKRSISDHLEEAVKYIKHMQQKIQALNDKRDGLRKEVSDFKGHDEYEDDDDVIVNVFNGSLEVIVSTNHEDGDQGFPLSKILQCLIQQGLDVVSSISNKVNTRFVHSIHAKVGDKDSNAIDAPNLKQKLAAVIHR